MVALTNARNRLLGNRGHVCASSHVFKPELEPEVDSDSAVRHPETPGTTQSLCESHETGFRGDDFPLGSQVAALNESYALGAAGTP